MKDRKMFRLKAQIDIRLCTVATVRYALPQGEIFFVTGERTAATINLQQRLSKNYCPMPLTRTIE